MMIVVPTPVSLVSTNVPANTQPEYAAATSYNLGDQVQVSAAHRVYQSLVAANVGNTPAASPLKWQDMGATDQYLMLDEFVNTASAAVSQLHVQVGLSRPDHFILLGVEGTSITLNLWDKGAIVWTETTNLVYTDPRIAPINNWQGYFFSQSALLYNDLYRALPVLTYSPTLEIIISYPGGTAKLAQVLAGNAIYIGETQYGSEVGILDYSKKTTDTFGRTYLAQGYFAKKNSLQVMVDRSRLDVVYQWLSQVRGIPAVWVGDDETDIMSLLIYGFCRDYSVVVDTPLTTTLRIEIEGLI